MRTRPLRATPMSRSAWVLLLVAASAVVVMGCHAREPNFAEMPAPIALRGDAAARRSAVVELVEQIMSQEWLYADQPKLEYVDGQQIRFSVEKKTRRLHLPEVTSKFVSLPWSDVVTVKIRPDLDPLVQAYVVEVHARGGQVHDWLVPHERAARELGWAITYLATRPTEPSLTTPTRR